MFVNTVGLTWAPMLPRINVCLLILYIRWPWSLWLFGHKMPRFLGGYEYLDHQGFTRYTRDSLRSKMIVKLICSARNLRFKVEYFCTELSSSRSFWNRNFKGHSGVVVVFFCFKSHTYNYSINGQWALILSKLGTWTIILGSMEYI